MSHTKTSRFKGGEELRFLDRQPFEACAQIAAGVEIPLRQVVGFVVVGKLVDEERVHLDSDAELEPTLSETTDIEPKTTSLVARQYAAIGVVQNLDRNGFAKHLPADGLGVSDNQSDTVCPL